MSCFKFFFKYYFYDMCMKLTCLHVCTQAREGIRSPGSRVAESWELSCRYWEPNPDPLQKEYVLLITGLSL